MFGMGLLAGRLVIKDGEKAMKWISAGLRNILSLWEEPLWLMAFLLIIPLLSLGKESRRKLEVRQRSGLPVVERRQAGAGARGKSPASTLHRLTRFRITAITLTILALAGTALPLPTTRRHLAVLIDVSDSITSAEREKSRAAVLKVLEKMKPADRVDLVIFSTFPQVLARGLAPQEASAVMTTTGLHAENSQHTNLEAALLTTDQLFKDVRGNKGILLLSDGRPNAGETSIEAWMKSSSMRTCRKIPIYAFPVGKTGNSLVSLGLDLPDLARPGENTLLGWEVFSAYKQKLLVTVRLNGKELSSQEFTLLPGRRRIPLTVQAPDFGAHVVELAISDERGVPVPHATCGGVLRVGGRARVLVVSEERDASPLVRALTVQGMEVQEIGVAGLPESLSGFASYSAVILDNVPALYLTERQEDALQSFVSGGGGLLVVGGDSSLGRGEYYASGLEELLPVQTDTRQRLLFTRAKILYLIDQSGSMAELVGPISKEKAALQGIAESLKELNPIDEVGILSFSDRAEWVLPFTSASNLDQIRRALSHTGQGGGTDLASGLAEAVQGLSGSGPLRRHVVILTDGFTSEERLESLCRRLHGMGATITTIGVGREVNEKILRSVAQWGEGQFYRAEDERIPQIIIKETIRVTRDLIQEGYFQPEVRTDSHFLRGLGTFLPVQGYLITRPKKMSHIYLEVGSEEKDPLLAGWRYGNGQVMVFTADSGRRWLARWSGSPLFNQFWGQVTRSIMKARIDTGLHLTTRVEGGAVRVLVDATGPDRHLRTGLQLVGRMGADTTEMFRLKETFPGRYEATLPTSGRGIQEFEVYELAGKSWTVGAVWLPPSDEYQSYGPDLGVLGYLTAVTGGRILTQEELEIPASLSWEPYPLRQWLLIAALFLFVLELAYRSTSLGQVHLAKTAFAGWWKRQQQVLDSLRAYDQRAELTETSGEKTQTAYKYLAQKRAHRSFEE